MQVTLEDAQLDRDMAGVANFARIYKATMKSCSEERVVAVKRTRNIVVEEGGELVEVIEYPMLRHEARALKLLQGHRNIPEIYFFAATQYFAYLGLQMLGTTLYTYCFDGHHEKRTLTVRNLGAIACQMIDALDHVHAHEIIHCDVSLSNILFDSTSHGDCDGRVPPSPLVYLIDFAICKPLRREEKDTPTPWLRGNPDTASLNAHMMQCGLSRRDDLESLAYCLIEILEGGLPWEDMLSLKKIFAAKKNYTGSCVKTSPWCSVFGRFLDYCRGLAHDDKPDYEGWTLQFKQICSTLEKDFLLDTDDKSTLKVKVPIDCDYTEDKDEESSDATETNGWRIVTHLEDPYRGDSHTDVAYTLEEYDMFGDEESVVGGIEHLDEVPVHELDIAFNPESCARPQLYVRKKLGM